MRNGSIADLLAGLVNFTFGLFVLGLGFRFFLRLFGANPEAGFVQFIYDSTNPLLDPFRNIFSPYVVETGHVFEFSTLFAMMIYVIIAWLIVEFIAYMDYQARSTYRK
jgi:uncharacterized protein YggT (Ycf19 family)